MAKTFQSIHSEIQKLQKEAEALRAKEIAEVVAKIKSAIAVYGITAADLGLGKPGPKVAAAPKTKGARKHVGVGRAKASRPVKYRDAAGNEWVGVGKRPAWFVAALAAGKMPADLLAT